VCDTTCAYGALEQRRHDVAGDEVVFDERITTGSGDRGAGRDGAARAASGGHAPGAEYRRRRSGG
jgi:hypothetical protein